MAFATLLDTLLIALYYTAPGLIANMIPVFTKKINFLDTPVDFGKSWKGARIFGDHKTYKGFFFGIISAIFLVYVQKLLYTFDWLNRISFVDYGSFSYLEVVWLGFLFGFGALFGDLIKSYFKRRAGIAPGKSFAPWDQLDYVLGIIVFVSLYKPVTLVMAFMLVIVAPMLHLITTIIGYNLGLKEEKW
ncbi:MAG: CDP-archaeol synthase [Candidatus Woesearchaeota archaeon]